MSIAARARLTGLDARRADTIFAGAVVFRTALELAGAEQATLCETALREGIIADYVASNRPGMLLVEEFPDLRRRTVMELARRCQFREDHGMHVARLALSIFDQTRRLHKLPTGDGELLEYAALLHDIGFYISPHRHHRHSAYLILNHAMTGFSRAEVRIIALAARHHRKVEPKRGRGLMRLLRRATAAASATWRPSCASPTRWIARTPGWCARCGARCRRRPSTFASTPTAIPSWRSGRRGARATCSRSCASESCVSPSTRSAIAKSGRGAPSREARRPHHRSRAPA